ncbi:ATP-dependent protease La domain-containing protein [Xylaria telfairii]|nr:ATP-dependent protease La domain-containing protein [Xylaria telfairii]
MASASPRRLSSSSSTPTGEGLPSPLSSDGMSNVAVPNPTGTARPEDSTGLLLDAVEDARQIIRLIQCQICSKILQDPITLPCGYSICRTCLPETRPRANISWPATAGRLDGLDCPLPDCGKEHAADDCAFDVTLSKILAIIKTAIHSCQSATGLSKYSTHITVRDQWSVAGIPSLDEKQSESRVLDGGRILATYTLAELGKLECTAEVLYSSVGASEDEAGKFDDDTFLKLKELVKTEVDCQVCYALFLDPVTTACGHTYCRTCIHRILDHSNLCPICRRTISIRAQADQRAVPSNKRLVSMINGFWADLTTLRSQTYRLEQQANHEGFDIPIFVCTLAFPGMPLFLHVFEPRYRLMIRRAMEGDRTFGMVLAKLTEPGFMDIGVLLRIVKIEYLFDGRSVLQTIGISRFRTTRHGLLDGYVVANIEKVDDISLAEEEALEASELSHASATVTPETFSSTSESTESPSVASTSPFTIPVDSLDSISTRGLVNLGVNFVRKMQTDDTYWLTPQILSKYGECPDSPDTFPWWFASVFPVSAPEKYMLLATSSVRERLKITCRWIAESETRSYQWS